MELERKRTSDIRTDTDTNYIIPIWNWSYLMLIVNCQLSNITLFLYGIGATSNVCNPIFFTILLHYSYMELEQECSISSMPWYSITLFLYGIGAVIILCFKIITHNYIIPIWNWSILFLDLYLQLLLNITLFLYGIGALSWILN